MRSEDNVRSFWIVLIGSFAAAAALAVSAIILVVQAFGSHGSLSANLLRVGLAAILLFLAVFLIAVGTLYWMSVDQENG